MQLYRPEPSHLKSKKYKVWVLRDGKPKLIHFGSRAHQHFRDKLGHYSAQDHNDERRRELYYARFGPLRTRTRPSGFHTNIFGKLNVDLRVPLGDGSSYSGVFMCRRCTPTRQADRRFHGFM
jgi:hypothetical protein